MVDLKTNLILVTGANGWLGKNLIDAIVNSNPDCGITLVNNKIEIRCLVKPGEDTSFLNNFSQYIQIYNGDITDYKSMSKFFEDSEGATLFHTAGVIHPKNINDFFEINVKGVKNLLDLSVEERVNKFIAVSSNSPFGVNKSNDEYFDEKSTFNPYMNYGKSKMMMEELVNFYFSKGKIKTVIIRPPWFYGPMQPDRQTLFFRMIKEGKVPIVGNGENLRSMAYTMNICQGLLLAASRDNALGNSYWIADETPYSMNEIISTIFNLLEQDFQYSCKKNYIKIPNFISDFAFFADLLIQKTNFYHQKIHVLSEMNKNIICSIAAAKKELGYKPKISLKEGMHNSIKNLLAQGKSI